MKNDDVQHKKSAGKDGLFANRNFKKDELIIEYTGEKISEEEANERGGKYLFELNAEWTIDGDDKNNLARFINHSCLPNCYPEIDETEEHIFIYAKKNIKEGEELTYNFGKMYFDSFIGKDNCPCSACSKKREKKDQSKTKKVEKSEKKEKVNKENKKIKEDKKEKIKSKTSSKTKSKSKTEKVKEIKKPKTTKKSKKETDTEKES